MTIGFAGLNTLDLLLILFLFIGVLVGLIRGAVSQIISAFSMWFGLVVTLWLYKPFSKSILQEGLSMGEGRGISSTVADSIAFGLLLLIFSIAIGLAIRMLTTSPDEPRKRRRKDPEDPLAERRGGLAERAGGCLNAVAGMVMGLILTTLWLSIILGVLQFIFQPTGVDVPYTGFARGLVTNLRQSVLVHNYFNVVLVGLARSVDLFIPRNADILKTVLRIILQSA